VPVAIGSDDRRRAGQNDGDDDLAPHPIEFIVGWRANFVDKSRESAFCRRQGHLSSTPFINVRAPLLGCLIPHGQAKKSLRFRANFGLA
jgi:hypothetical protein